MTTAMARRLARATVEVLLTVASVVGVLMAGLTGLALVLRLHAVVVRSDSMSPALPAGSLLFVRDVPAEHVHPGQVVSVVRTDGLRVTHRVVSVGEAQADRVRLQLRGDADQRPDPRPYLVRTVGAVVWHAPRVGRVAHLFATGPGGYVLGSTTTAVLFLLMGQRRQRPKLPQPQP